jgi:hypothetical protein
MPRLILPLFETATSKYIEWVPEAPWVVVDGVVGYIQPQISIHLSQIGQQVSHPIFSEMGRLIPSAVRHSRREY